MGSIPLPALSIRPPENPLDQYAKALSVKSMLGGQQLQQEQIKQAQIGTQTAGIGLQMQQLALKNMQVTQSALSDPKITDEFDNWQEKKGEGQAAPIATGTAPGSTMGVTLHPLAQFLAEKKGLPFMGPGGALELSNQLTKASQDVATLLKTQGDTAKTALENHSKQIDSFNDRAAPVFEETDPAKQKTALGQLKNELLANQDLYPPEIVAKISDVNSEADLANLYNSAKVRQMVLEEGTKKAEEQTAKATALQKTRMAGGVTDENGKLNPQAQAAVDSIKTFGALSPAQRIAATKEFETSPDMESLLKTRDRWDSINESAQRSQDAMQNARAMKDVAVGQAMATQLIGEDKALQASLAQTAGIRSILDMSKGGNEAATAAAQTRFAEHEIVEGGVKRMNQLEYNQLVSNLGDYGRQFSAWVAKGFAGNMPAATNREMQAILDAEDAVAHKLHDDSVGLIQNRFSQIAGGGIVRPVTPATPAAPSTNDPFAQFGGFKRP